MEHCKLQIGCLIVVLYVAFMYHRERIAYKVRKKEPIFEGLLMMGIVGITLDGITAYTVNHLETIPGIANRLLHMFFLCSLDTIVFFMFLYILEITGGIPLSKRIRGMILLPFIINLAIVICCIPELRYIQGEITNYSMGISAYTCFIMVAVYMLATLVILFVRWQNLGRHKLITVTTYVLISILVTTWQMMHPQALISCMVPTMAILGSYLNMENPVFVKLRAHNKEMVMGFATLVENRDDNTGGHIRRTTEYVKLLAEELRNRGIYREQLTKDYIKNLVMAAPMHDVGKIAIPDAILQKPGKLTEEEYEVMKTHAARGGKIIQETFGLMGEDEYENMAYEVARHHHEKWNGNGYPDRLAGPEIPLCARIMAVADVFDAVSAKRCYRDALPLEECFAIIERGSGQDFDPVIADIFLEMRDKILEVYKAT